MLPFGMILLLQDCLNGRMEHDTEVLGFWGLGCWAGTEPTISKAANRTHCPYCDNSPSQNEALAQFTVGDSSLAFLSGRLGSNYYNTALLCRKITGDKKEWMTWMTELSRRNTCCEFKVAFYNEIFIHSCLFWERYLNISQWIQKKVKVVNRQV